MPNERVSESMGRHTQGKEKPTPSEKLNEREREGERKNRTVSELTVGSLGGALKNLHWNEKYFSSSLQYFKANYLLILINYVIYSQ